MNGATYRLRILALLTSLMAGAASAASISVSHHDVVGDLALSSGATGVRAEIDRIAPLRINFDALGRTFDLELEPNARLLTAMRESRIGAATVPYKGRIAGVAGSWASITFNDGVPAGLIFDGTEMYAVEAPGDSAVEADTPVIYRLADAVITDGSFSCGADASAATAAETFSSTVGDLQTSLARAADDVSEITIGAVGDFEFTHVRSDPEGDIVTRLNNVDAIFTEQVGVQINVSLIETFGTVEDPFSDTDVPTNLLQQLASYRSTTPAQRTLGLTHLYTGRDLAGNTVGIAYTRELCDTFAGAGLSEGSDSVMFDSLVAAHEIGHNFGAGHDGIDEPCDTVTGQYIMSATLNQSARQFSQCSIDVMQAHAAEVSCVTPAPSSDVAIRFDAEAPTVLLSNAVTLTFDVVNNGTQSADNISVEITIPDNVLLLTASGSTGSCDSGAGVITCQPANLVGGSSATISLSGTTISAGSGTFNATATATVDDNPGNNSVTVDLTVEPAVDLIANAPLPAEVEVDRNTTVAVIVENESTQASSAVDVSIALDPGLRATSASWGAGSCTVADRQVDCSSTGVAGMTTATISLGIAGVTRGAQSFTATVSSSDTDADPANNTATGSVRVTAAAGSSDDDDDGGTGGTGIGFLLILLACIALRTRRRESANPLSG